jgi:hypothetical protein
MTVARSAEWMSSAPCELTRRSDGRQSWPRAPGKGRQCDTETFGHVPRQFDVLLDEPQGEPGLCGRVEDEGHTCLQHGGADSTARHHVEGESPVDTGPVGEQQTLGEREHLHDEADVDRELEHQPLPVRPDVRRRAQLAQDRLDAAVRVLVSAHHDRERSGLHLGNAARDRCVEHGRSERVHSLRELAARPRADRAHVRPDLSDGEAGEDPVGACGDRTEHPVVGHGRENHVGRLGDLARRRAPPHPVVGGGLHPLAVSLCAVHLVAGIQETNCHVAAHVPEAHEADLRRRRRGHLSPSLRSF